MRFISMYSCGAVRAGQHAIFADFDVVSHTVAGWHECQSID